MPPFTDETKRVLSVVAAGDAEKLTDRQVEEAAHVLRDL